MKIRVYARKLALLSALLSCTAAAMAQVAVTGVVRDTSGEPVIGASILELGTTNGTITDIDGSFSMTVLAKARLQFSYMGYQTQELDAAPRMDIVLEEDSYALTEVVAIGYGSQKKKEVTGSVASIKAEDFNVGVKTNPVGLLQGKVAGLSISRQGADPTNTGYNIQIRGFSTLGKGTGSSPLYIVDGVPVSNIDNVAPEEIASMDVLKDGSAAAIYGTRGTNGVIIITTKRGSGDATDCGKMQVDYSGFLSVSLPRGKTGMATPEQYRNLSKLSGNRVTPVLNDDETNTDWMAEMMRPAALTHNHNLALSGSTKKFGYRASLAFKDAQGIAKKSGRQEVIAKIAANQKALDGWLDLQYDLSYMHYRNDIQCGDFKQAATLNPTYKMLDSTQKSGYFVIPGTEQNPIMAQQLKEKYQTGNYFRGSVKASVNIKPVPGLKLNAFAAIEEGDNYTYYYCSQNFAEDPNEAGKASRETAMNLNQLYETTVDYAGAWNGHNLVAVAGFSYQNFFGDYSKTENQGFPTDNYKYYSIGNGQSDRQKLIVSSYRNSNVLASTFARLNYNYEERYLLSASVRCEGSSRFGANHKWGWFPAVSAGWRISGENFMSGQAWCNDLKMRFGFGVTGNNLGEDLRSLQLLQSGGTFWYGNKYIDTYTVANNANPNLRWEKKYEYNLGVDFAFLDNRLSGTLDLYYRDTKDLLWDYDVPTPPYQYNKLLANAGRIASKGIEVSLTGVPVKLNGWEWTSTWTMAFNNNKILTLSDPKLGFNYTTQLSGSVWEEGKANTTTQKIVEGESVGTFYGYKHIGITTDGQLVYEKYTQKDYENGLCQKDDVGKTDKLQAIGSAQPIFTYGWNNTIRWKNLDITLFFRGNVGNKVFNVKRWAFGPKKSQGGNVFMKDVFELAQGTGVYSQKFFSDYYLEDGSFLKLDNVTVGYTFPFKNNKYIQSVRIHATAENVFTITKYSGIDPDVNTSSVWDSGIDASGFYPSVCNVMVGLGIVLF